MFWKYAANLQEDTHAIIALWHGCSPVNLLHILGPPFPKNTFERYSLNMNITITLAMQSTKITKGFKLKRFFSLLCNTSKNAWSLPKNFRPNRPFSFHSFTLRLCQRNFAKRKENCVQSLFTLPWSASILDPLETSENRRKQKTRKSLVFWDIAKRGRFLDLALLPDLTKISHRYSRNTFYCACHQSLFDWYHFLSLLTRAPDSPYAPEQRTCLGVSNVLYVPYLLYGSWNTHAFAHFEAFGAP